MKIQNTNLTFGAMTLRSSTRRIILHHAAASVCSASDIHRWHLANGWSGAGYHFLVRKDGTVYRLRPEKYVGAHAIGANQDSIGICFEGHFGTEQMKEIQKQAGKELIAELKRKHRISKVEGHREVSATDCPGKNFPLKELKGEGKVEPAGSEAKGSGTRKDAWIASIQAECNKQGFSNQVVDGIYGPVTLSGCPTLRYGARGNITRLVQQRLTSFGFPCGDADGILGPLTSRGIRNFQEAKGLVVDGIVGVNTWRALLTA